MIMIEYIFPEKCPKAIGPYSPAVVVDFSRSKLVFISGQLPLDPQTGKVVEGDIKIATRQTLENVKNALEASGSSLEHVLRVDIFLRDMADFAGMNEVYKTFFTEGKYPARQTTQSHINVLVEISCISIQK